MEHFDLDYYGRLRDLPNDVIAREFEWRYPERANAATEVCDRHAQEGRGLAIRWLGIDGSTRDVTYTEARATTNRVANMLARHGVGEGDRVFTVTNLFAVPTFLRMLRRRESVLEEEGLALSLRRGGSVGEALDPATLQWAKERLGITVFEFYGQTEHGALRCALSSMSQESRSRRRSGGVSATFPIDRYPTLHHRRIVGTVG
jgi:acyl-coenzyme A synthetase/AMP-(fatty) acid ligase